MAKKVQIYFRDDFKPGEFPRLATQVIQALRLYFPGFIIHPEAMENYREKIIIYVYGIWGDGAVDALTATARQVVDDVMVDGAWIYERHLARQGLEASIAAAALVREEEVELVPEEIAVEQAEITAETAEEGQE